MPNERFALDIPESQTDCAGQAKKQGGFDATAIHLPCLKIANPEPTSTRKILERGASFASGCFEDVALFCESGGPLCCCVLRSMSIPYVRRGLLDAIGDPCGSGNGCLTIVYITCQRSDLIKTCGHSFVLFPSLAVARVHQWLACNKETPTRPPSSTRSTYHHQMSCTKPHPSAR